MRMLKGMFMTCGARAPSKLVGWGAARHPRGAGHESRINPNNLPTVKFVAVWSWQHFARSVLCLLCGLLVT